MERTRVMGIVNITPDSFSDGGKYIDTRSAVAHALKLVEDGADVIDIGGESTRPGAARVPVAEEQSRVIPVLKALVSNGVAVSVDTMNARTALLAADEGAAIINDVSGGKADPDMAAVVASTGLPFVVMHWRGHSEDMNALASYKDVAADVRRELKNRIAELFVAGVQPSQIILDPGLGFAKDAQHNWQLLARLGQLASLGYPLLIGASRKRYLADFVPKGDSEYEHPRDFATAVVSALADNAGAWGVRVHDVASTRLALDVAEAWRGGQR
jgi:dihydropteroate synthase